MSLHDHLDPDDYVLPAELRERLLSPSLIVWMDKVRANIARVIDALGGDPLRWRPHVKTTKLPRVWRELTVAGVRHFKCATTREVEHLLRTLDDERVSGDVLVSHALIGPNLRLLGDLAAQYSRCRVSVVVEDPSVALELPPHVNLFLDINPGMDRTGVPIGDTRRMLEIARAAGPLLKGVHYYDGHLHQRGPARREAIHAGYDQLVEVVEMLAAEGHEVPEVVTAGTPAFLLATTHRPLQGLEGTQHRVSPGTVVFHDARSSEQNPEFELDPAALVFTRVISHPREGRVTCDAGSKSIATEAGNPAAIVLGRPGLVARTASEEHLPFDVLSGEAPLRGEELLLVPRHVCPTVNLAEEVVLMEGREFLGVERIVARAHDVLAP